MASDAIRVDLGPDERARREAGSRRRGIDALDRLRDLWQGGPEIGERAFDDALTADRAELEARARRGSPD